MTSEGVWIQPRNYIQEMTKLYEDEVGKIKAQQLPADSSIQLEDKSEALTDAKLTMVYRSIVGSGIYRAKRGMTLPSRSKSWQGSKPNSKGVASSEKISWVLEIDSS